MLENKETPLVNFKIQSSSSATQVTKPMLKINSENSCTEKIVSFLASTSTAITNLNYSRRKMKPFWPKSSPLNQGTWLPGVRKQMKATQLLNRP